MDSVCELQQRTRWALQDFGCFTIRCAVAILHDAKELGVQEALCLDIRQVR
jgi:hypothetical protein